MSKKNPPGEKDFEQLNEDLKTKSFRVKRILLELPNYSYYHSVINKDSDDINNRFVGRKAIIDRLRSFIHETSKNTGTYLVTGFRGMGKTSVVNKAISSLSPRSKFTNYFYLWFSLLPIVIYLDKALTICNLILQSRVAWLFWPILIISTIILILYLGHRSPHGKRRNEAIFSKNDERQSLWNWLTPRLKDGFQSLINSKFHKHKFKFHRFLKFTIIYVWFTLFSLFYFKFYLFLNNCSNNDIEYGDIIPICKELFLQKHSYFLFTILLVTLCYLIIDIYIDFIKVNQLKIRESKELSGKDKNRMISLFKTSAIVESFIVFFLVLTNFTLINNGIIGFVFCFVLFFVYVFLKGKYKTIQIKNSKEKYKTLLSRVLSFMDFQHYITIKVNLGKDKLTEKDVLKYVTNELLREYRKWYYNFSSFKRFANIILLSTLLYIISTIIFKTILGEEFKSFTRNDIHLASFFPSQAIIEIEDVDLDSLLMSSSENHSGKLDQYILNIEDKYIRYRDSLNKGSKVQNVSKIKIGYKSLIKNRKNWAYDKANQSFLNEILVGTAVGSNEIDYLFLKVWNMVRQIIVGHKISNIKDHHFSFIKSPLDNFYPKVPILAVYFIMFLLTILVRFIPNRYVLLKTHYFTLRELKTLKKLIDASVEYEMSGSATMSKNPILNYAKRTSYQPLEEKDITQRLIHILDEVSQLNSIFVKLRFVFIFDELDKISTHFNSSIANIEDEFDVETNEIRYQARRKERIGRILSSMKHFLNSAQAKFIFIAGREMYDAALAGISDRESSLDSIFNDNKIYVNSFYKEGEDNKLADITSITEQYLCQFLIPLYYRNKSNPVPCLALYNSYLLEEEGKINNQEEKNERKAQRIKIITTLKDFIVYLTYRCNGAPRKLSNLIEQYIIPVSDFDIDSEDSRIMRIVVGKNNENPYLKLGYYDQYKFSLISYLTSPIFFGIGNYMHEYSDKLLVSISYMLDHLFKHHKFGISYRSLSLTPEIVDINKEPQFREFLDKLINLLSKSHLRPIVSGIYDYKFNGKISSEIKFLSKIDEHEAAAFNFTLDESIELKRHFNRRLEDLKTKTEKIVIANSSHLEHEYVNNISLLHMMIGDLHFYDEEYQEAIVHYLDAIQSIRQKNFKEMNLYDFILYIRNKLKLGLAFEKNKMFDNALMTFSELTDLIIRKRNISLRKIGLARFIIKEGDLKKLGKEVDIATIGEITKRIQLSSRNETIIIGRLKTEMVKSFKFEDNTDGYEWKKIYGIEDLATYYGMDSYNVFNNLESIETNYKELKNYFLLSTGESIRLLYQPTIAKLHLIEKTSPDKLKEIDIIRAIKEFNFIKAPLNTEAKRVIVAEFYNKIGDLLYFKNGTLNRTIKYQLKQNIDKKEACSENSKRTLMSPIDSCFFYIKSLAVLLDSKIGLGTNPSNSDIQERRKETIDFINFYTYQGKTIDDKKDQLNITQFLSILRTQNLDSIFDKIEVLIETKSYKQRYSAEYLSSIANGLIDLAGVLLSFNEKSKSEFGNSVILRDLYKALDIDLFRILNLYHYASEIYTSIGESRLAKSQKIKLLYVLVNCNDDSLSKITRSQDFFLFNDYDNLEDFIVSCIEVAEGTHNQSSHVEKQKLKQIFSDENDKNSITTLNGSVAGSEIEELTSLYYLILFKFYSRSNGSKLIETFTQFHDKRGIKKKIEKYLDKKINPNTIVRRKNNRILNLVLFLSFNKFIFDKSLPDHLVILNSIGACNELIKAHNLFGINYVTTNHMDLAKAHYRMGFWCKQLKELKKGLEKETRDKYDDIIKKYIINSESLNYFDHNYHYKLAMDYNRNIIDFHTRGSALQTFKKSVSYLDDFFNDNLVHFSIAIERNHINSLDNLYFNFELAKDELDSKSIESYL